MNITYRPNELDATLALHAWVAFQGMWSSGDDLEADKTLPIRDTLVQMFGTLYSYEGENPHLRLAVTSALSTLDHWEKNYPGLREAVGFWMAEHSMPRYEQQDDKISTTEG